MNYKTPGIFVEEKSLFPPSVATVATAIPAFIGYTKKAFDDENNQDLSNLPTRITSLLEYKELFGGGQDESDFEPTSYDITVNATTKSIDKIAPKNAANDRKYHLFKGLRHFYDNGGGACYIVSVGVYPTAIALGNDTSGLQGGLKQIKSIDEPTLLLFPDAVELDLANLSALQVLALAQCEDLKDRFVVMDIKDGFKKGNDPIQNYRDNIGTENLKYGATYTPWLVSTYSPKILLDKLKIKKPDNTDFNAGEIEGFGNLNEANLVTRAFKTKEDIETFKTSLPSLSLPLKKEFNTRTNTFKTAGNRVNFNEIFSLLRTIVISFKTLDDSTLDSQVNTSLEALKADAKLIEAIVNLIKIEKNAGVMAELMPNPRTALNVDTDYATLNNSAWVSIGGVVTAISSITADATINVNANGAATILARGKNIFDAEIFISSTQKILNSIDNLYGSAILNKQIAEDLLFSNHSWFKGLSLKFKRETALVPPSGAVVGAYASVDRIRGVWKAPANVSLNAMVAPAFKIDDKEQENLNVHTTGKSINVIRAFTGKGNLIWGAKTLAGNDNEWRYVPVRRFFNFAEESIKKASEPFVFDANDANTWVRVKAMIENFLTLQWRAGALAGAKPNHAFYVKIGLGETMTALDILEGRMIVEIGMAVVRPAEYIILRFSHKMQES